MLSKIIFLFFCISLSVSASWNEYKELYITKNGKVVDKNNGDITHSEGIGYAMYLALHNHDLATFYKIHTWYKKHLKLKNNTLIGWKWGKDKNNQYKLLDSNNATDGDLWIAYDNLLAYEITHDLSLKEEALYHIQNIKKYLIFTNKGITYLLPGRYGFKTKTTFEINLSYYIFFIFDKFAQYDDKKIWQKLKADGIQLLYKARFSPLHLNPDWITIKKKDNSFSLSKNHLFGYDAIRIPLHIIKSNLKNKKKLLQPYKNYLKSMKAVQTIFGTANLKKGTISLYNYGYVHLVIYNMLDKLYYKENSFDALIKKFQKENKNDYYSYSIYLLSDSL